MTVTMGETLAARIFAGPAFQSFNLDILFKLGGSLLKDIELAERIAAVLANVRKEKRIAVFPGGGPTDKVIEAIAEQANIASEVINPACMRALDQTGIIFAALHPDITATQDLHSFRQILAEGRLPVLLPSSLILSLDVFTRNNVLTSDTLGAYFSFLLGAHQFVVLTDTDGIYENFEGGVPHGPLLQRISATELEPKGHTCVDRCFAPFLKAVGLSAWILNGRHPERITALVQGRHLIGTEVTP
jgi:aspartokinase-like uncharacterized kinase